MAKRSSISSTARIFERRGDPWVTPKEGVKDFARNLATEDVDRDAEAHKLSSNHYLSRSERAAKDTMVRQVKPEKAEPPDKSFALAITQVRMGYRAKERENTVNIHEPPPRVKSAAKGVNRSYKRPEKLSNYTPGIKD
jgi:hypothetical protein